MSNILKGDTSLNLKPEDALTRERFINASVMEIQETIRIAIIPRRGVFEANVTKGGTVSVNGGYEHQFLTMLLQGMNVPYKLQVPPDYEWGTKLENGKWTGLMGMVTNNKSDMAIGNIFLKASRVEDIDYSFPYNSERVTFGTINPKEVLTMFTFVYSFTPVLWICLIMTVILFPVVLKYLMFKRNSLDTLFFNVLRSVVNQAASFRTSTISDKLLISSWLLAALLISLSYSTVLLSFLTIPILEKGVNNIQDLSNAVKQGTMKCYFLEGSVLPRDMSKHIDPSIRFIMEEVIKNSWFLQAENDIVQNTILGDMNAFVGTDKNLKEFLGNEIFVSRDDFGRFQLVVILNKRFKMRERLSYVIHRITASGIYTKTVQDYFNHKMADVDAAFKMKDVELQMTIQRLSGAFLLLFIGNTAASCVLGIEIIHYKILRRLTQLVCS